MRNELKIRYIISYGTLGYTSKIDKWVIENFKSINTTWLFDLSAINTNLIIL